MLKSKFSIALIVAVASGILAWFYLDSRETELLHRGKLIKVITAKHYLSAYSRIKASDLKWREIPLEYQVKGYISSSEDAIDQLSLVAFNEGEPLTYNKISSGNASLSNSVPEGMRAISIPVDKVSGIAGMIKPGDLVDLLYLDEARKPNASVAMLFQGVKVLASGDTFSEHQEKSDSNGSVTLALNPEDAQVAMLAYTHGVLQLSLRSIGDGHLIPSRTVRIDDIQRRLSRHVEAVPALNLNEKAADFIPQKR